MTASRLWPFFELGRRAREALLGTNYETYCPAGRDVIGEYAICSRSFFDGILRCSRCGADVPSASHPMLRPRGGA